MKKFEVRSEYPCLVKWKGGEEFLEDGIAIVFDEPEKLFVYPATGRRDDVAFVLDMNAPGQNVKSFSLEEKELFFLEGNNSSSTIVKESISVLGKNIDFKIGLSTAQIENNDFIKTVNILKPKTYQLLSIENFAVLKIKSLSQEQALLFNTKTNEIETITATKIEITDGQILCEKFGHEEKYIIADEKLVKTKSVETISHNPKITPMLFLQKIKNKEFHEASLFLDARLGASEEKLNAYFGEVKNVLPLNENEFLLQNKNGFYQVRLETKDDKIINIEIKD